MLSAWLVYLLLLSAQTNAQRCWVDGEWSSCSNFQDCPTAIASIWERNVIPPLCRVEGDNPVICCPPEPQNDNRDIEATTVPSSSTTTENTSSADPPYSPPSRKQPPPELTPPKSAPPSGRGPSGFSISSLKCREYSAEVFARPPIQWTRYYNGWVKKMDTCFARRIARVVGGHYARPKEFPHLVLIDYGSPHQDNSHHNPPRPCGGTLISRRFVLTAAHCCNQQEWGAPRSVRIGDLDTATDIDFADPLDVPVDSCVVHPDWDSKSLYHDLALIRLQHQVPLSPFIRPACLPSPGPLQERHAIAAGWGRTSFAGEFSTHLKKVMLEVLDFEVCNASYFRNVGMFGHIPDGLNSTTHLCASAPYGQDTCQGDSALQQLLMEPYCMYQIIGVLSFGKYCGSDQPTVYTRVSHYVPWIESIVWNGTSN